MKRVSAPSDKRFRRAHVSPARRRGWRPALATRDPRRHCRRGGRVRACTTAVAFVFTTGALQVARITVEGNTRMSRGEVLSRLDGLEGAHMLTVDLEQWRERLRARRGWPTRRCAGCSRAR